MSRKQNAAELHRLLRARVIRQAARDGKIVALDVTGETETQRIARLARELGEAAGDDDRRALEATAKLIEEGRDDVIARKWPGVRELLRRSIDDDDAPFVTLAQACAAARGTLSKRTVQKWPDLPEPDRRGGGGSASFWRWPRLRDVIREHGYDAPDRFPG